MSKNVIHNFNLSIKNSADLKSSEELTQTIIKELAKVSKEMSQQKDIVQLWQEQQNQNAAVNNFNASTEGGAIDTTSNKLLSISNTPSVSGQEMSIVPLENASISNALIGEGVADTTGRITTSSSTSANITSPKSGAENSTTTQTYANVAAQQTLTLPQKFQANSNEPTIEVIKAEIKKKLDFAIIAKDTVAMAYWTGISKAFDNGATPQNFVGKPNNILFTQMYVLLKELNPAVIENQNFNWDVVRKKMIESIDVNILKGKISQESKNRWKTIRKQLTDDNINIANLFEQYDELFLLLKEVEGLEKLPNTITITTKTKIYPNLSADKLYAAIGKKNVYVFLKEISDTRGSAVNKGAVKIKNTEQTSFLVGESLEFILDETFINENLFNKENINWIVYNVENDIKTIFADKGTLFNYNFDKAGTYRVEAFGKNDTVKGNKNIDKTTFIELKILAQEIIITPPVIIKSKFIRSLAEEQVFKISLKNSKVKTLNPLKLYYQVENTNNKKVTVVLGEQELDSTGIVKFSMQNLGEYCIKVTSKDQYNVTQKHSITVIKNFIDSIEKIKDNTENDVYFYSKTNQNTTFKVKNFRIEPATQQEKENVKWLVYDKNGKIYIPDGLKLQVENNDVENSYFFKGESFVFPIPKTEGDFTVEAYSNSKEGIKSKSSRKICVKYPQVTEAQWTYKNANKKKTSGFSGEINYIKASIPGYGNKPVRINLFLNDSKVVNYYNDTKTNENGEINKVLKFDANLQKHFGIQKGKTAKIRFELEGFQNGKEPYLFKKTANAYEGAVLNVTSCSKITDIYFKYEGNRVTPFTKVPYGSKVTGVVRTLNMVGKEVTLNIFKDAQNVKHSKKTIVDNEGGVAINFILDKKWHEVNLLLGTMDMFYLGMQGIASKLSFENGLNAVPADIIISDNNTIGGNKYGIDIPYFLAKYDGGYKNNLKVLLNDMNEYFAAEKIIPRKEQVAYMLATVFTETFHTFKPVMEGFWIDDKTTKEASFYKYDPVLADTKERRETAIARGNTKKGDGVKYCGRGYVQLTWKNNYQKVKDKFGVDVVNYPDKAMEPKLAVKIMIWGMNNGIFTGVGINRFINDSKTDYVNARKVINGTNKSKEIAEDARKFVKGLKIIQNSETVKPKSLDVGNVNVQNKKTDNNTKKTHSKIVTFASNLSQERINQVSNTTIKVLENAAIDSSNKSVIITSTIRSTLKQAEAMYENESHGRHISYKEPGQKVIRVYNNARKSGKSKNEIIKLMDEKIIELSNLGQRVSRHCVSEEVYKKFNIVDVSFNFGLTNIKDFINSLVHINAVTKIIHPIANIKKHDKIIYDPKEGAIHIEIKQ